MEYRARVVAAFLVLSSACRSDPCPDLVHDEQVLPMQVLPTTMLVERLQEAQKIPIRWDAYPGETYTSFPQFSYHGDDVLEMQLLRIEPFVSPVERYDGQCHPLPPRAKAILAVRTGNGFVDDRLPVFLVPDDLALTVYTGGLDLQGAGRDYQDALGDPSRTSNSLWLAFNAWGRLSFATMSIDRNFETNDGFEWDARIVLQGACADSIDPETGYNRVGGPAAADAGVPADWRECPPQAR